jgi:hypothetical protein
MRRTAKTRTQKPLQYGYYLVDVSGWHFSYYLGSHNARWETDPYSEHATIEVIGALLGPTSSRCSIAHVSLAIRDDMGKAARISAGPKPNPCVGYVEKRGETLVGYIALSEQAFYGLVPMFAADRIRALVLHGPRLFRGKALVTWLAVETAMKIEDYPSDYS